MSGVSIETHNLTVAYDRAPVLWDVDFELPVGQIVGVVGPNGSGKSTMIKTIMGIVKPSGGYAKVLGEDISQVRDKVAYVPQRESIDWDFPASVKDVVLMGRYRPGRLFRRMGSSDKLLVKEALEQVGLEGMMDRQISQLSGGQQQRVFIARALVRRPEVFLMDEPFVGVDAATETTILELLKELRQQGKTVVIVHHDLQTVRSYFDHLVMLNTRLVACGPVDEVFNEENLNQTYGGKLNLLTKVAEEVRRQEMPLKEKDSKSK